MPNSDATTTRDKIILRAFRRIGIGSPSTTDKSDAASLLNDLIKEVDEKGEWLWSISNIPTALSILTGTQTYSVGAAPGGIASGIIELKRFELVKGTNLVPLRVIEKHESIATWERETPTGEPVMAFLEVAPDPDDSKLWLYPTPSGPLTGQYYFRRRLYDFDSATDNPDFPQSWNNRLVKLLAPELADEFSVPLDERQWLTAKGDKALMDGQAANSQNAHRRPTRTKFY